MNERPESNCRAKLSEMQCKEDKYSQSNLADYVNDVMAENSGLSDEELTDALYKRRYEALINEEREKKREEEEEKRRIELEQKKQHEAHIQEVTSMELPLDWNNIFDSDERTAGVHADSAADALVMSLTTLGRVDIEYMSSVTGMDYKEIISVLKGSIYQNPDTWNECFYKGWETSDEYLSGNMMRKWKSAKRADKEYNGYFSDNIKAIEKVLPPAVLTEDIYVTLGSPWVPADVIDDFLVHLFGDPHGEKWNYWEKPDIENHRTRHDNITGTWEIPNKSRYNHSIAVSQTYGTRRMEALEIIEKTLNMKTVTVMDEVSCSATKSGKKRVINKEETLAVIEKQKQIVEEFQKWIWSAPNRKERLEIIFENKYSCIRRRIFDGSFLSFSTMSPEAELYPYQKDAVARILFSPNTLLAHDVGAGKTYVMIAAGQELSRMGLSNKNMYVVPNNIVNQWRDIFLNMYPDANILCVDPGSFKPGKRQDVLEKIRDEEFDGIIIAYSCFGRIPLSAKYRKELLREEKRCVEKELLKEAANTSKLKKELEKIIDELSEVNLIANFGENEICFDDLGVTRLFVDEAHNFKNVPIDTKIDSVLGINSKGSKKCWDMMEKVHMVQRSNDGKGVIMATGTPVTNSITDAYIMQQYLQSGELAMLELQSFDAWVGMFAERRTEFEIDVDTSTYRLATRFSRFHNLPELTALLSSIADFHQADEADGVPSHNGYHDEVIIRTREFSDYLKNISIRADEVRQGRVRRTKDNMLKITTDGRKAALDIRLVQPEVSFSFSSKVARCVDNVADIYYKTAGNKSTQLIFCDISTPKEGFNIYSDLKDHLVGKGIPAYQIAFVHDADTERKRSEMFERMRRGDIRILIGSTFKLGQGVNIQDRLVALHHIDVPWRPADMTQREGRILRQGNMNKEVFIYRYITEGSFDAYSWQLLETKQNFISELLSGSLLDRSASDIEDTVLDYAEVKALAVGNPLIRERVEAANELNRYLVLQKRTAQMRMVMEQELLAIPGNLEYQHSLIMKCEKDLYKYRKWQDKHSEPADETGGKAETENRSKLREKLQKSFKKHVLESNEKTVAKYKGFSLVLPSGMTIKNPCIWVVGYGRYYVELGNNRTGNLIRIDNCLDTLGERLEKLKAGKEKIENRKKDIEEELARNENYSDQIEEYRQRVEELDKKLEADKNE